MSITSPVRRTPALVSVLVVVGSALLAGPTAPAGARAAVPRVVPARPAAPGSTDVSPAAEIASLTALVGDRTQAQALAVSRRDATARRLNEARLAENLAIQQADLLGRTAVAADQAYRAARKDAGAMAAAYYKSAGSPTVVVQMLQSRSAVEFGYRQKIAQQVGEKQARIVRRALVTRRAAIRATKEAENAQAEWHARADRYRAEMPRREADIVEAQARLSRARFWLARWQSISAGVNTPIMSHSVLGPSELTEWFQGTHRRARITVPVAQLAQFYIEEGEAAQVRGDIAFAQSILETGSFSFPDGGQLTPTDNNFAGMDACDSCAHGRAFPDARTGVRAQLQQLRVYADPTVTNASFDPPPVVANLDQHHLKGKVPTWNGLTHTWATADTYGDRILSIYEHMLAWLMDRADI